jgi:hypothetical protein
MRAFICTLSCIAMLTAPFSALHAQTASTTERINGGAGGIPELQEQVSYTVLPERPNIGDTVDFKAEMYGTPVQDAIFDWEVNGRAYKQGQGVNQISVFIDADTTVNVTIETISGQTLYKQWVFNPKKVIIFWEANTYTPPFYKGKSLYTAESGLKLYGINLDAKNPLTNNYANYVWKMDGKVKGNDSGVSKNTFTYQGDILQQEPYFELLYSNVTSYAAVKAGQSEESINVRSVLRVKTLLSDIFTYEKTPLLGILFNKKVPTVFPVTRAETSLVAYPMYYSLDSSLLPNYTWTLNDNIIKRNSNILTFKKTADNEQSRLTLYIENAKSLLQSKDVTYVIDTNTKSTGFTSAENSTGFGR